MGLDQYLYVVTKEELRERIEIENMSTDTAEELDLQYEKWESWYEKACPDKRPSYRYWRKQKKTHEQIMLVGDLCAISSHMWYFQSSFGTDICYADEKFPSLIGTDTYYLYTISY
jgi:hypothetical protein